MLNKIIRKANRDDESNFRREEYESSLYFGNLGRNCNDKDIEEKNNILRNFLLIILHLLRMSQRKSLIFPQTYFRIV